MARARQRWASGETPLDGEARLIDAAPPGAFAVGARVFHRKFGYGTVSAADGDRLDIDFDKAGKKKVISDFVVPEEQAG